MIHDEGPDKDGGVGPYVQSERQAAGIYLEYAKKLIEKGEAYYCFCTQERLDSLRTNVNGEEIMTYDKHCLHLSKEEIEANLAAGMPVWIIILGALFAIGVGKMSFGGLGCNPFNPALAGRVFLLLSFPVQMTSWPVVGQLTAYTDATTGATPLALMKQAIYGNTDALSQIPDALSLLIGQNGGCLGEVSALALLIGLAYMLWKKIITWHIPVSILVTVFVFAGIMHLADPEKYVSPVLQLLSGGLMLGAVFMATDYVTSPMSKKGMLIYGVCIGLLTVVIRLFGAYPEGMSFAILIMNAFTPLINTYCKPKRFGEVAKKK